jgi:hypothetical protein
VGSSLPSPAGVDSGGEAAAPDPRGPDSSQISRRRLLQLGALTGTVAAASGALGGLSRAAASTGSGTDGPSFPDGASKVAAERAQLQSFEGAHQLSVLSEPSRASTVVSFDVVAGSRA